MPDSGTQQQRIDQMLTELGITSARFAELVGVDPVTVSRWKTGGRSIRKDAAAKIERAFPQYSAAWIRGLSPYENADVERGAETSARFSESYLSGHASVDAAIRLAASIGYSVKLPNERVEQDGSAAALCDSVMSGLVMNAGVRVTRDGRDATPRVLIEHDGTTAEITIDALESFADELADFAAVRLSRIVSENATVE